MPVNPLEVRQRESVYRRGVLLGMTMAEIMILLLFCLLMAFVLRLDDYQDRLEQNEKAEKLLEDMAQTIGSYDDAWSMLSKLHTVVAQLGPDALNQIAAQISKDETTTLADIASAVDVGLKQYSSMKTKLTAKADEGVTPDEVRQAIEQQMAEAEKYARLEPVAEALTALEEALQEANGRQPSAEELNEALQQMIAMADASQGEGNSTLAEKYNEAVALNQDLKERSNRLERALNKATDQLAGKGQGLVYPSCFVAEDGSTQYIFSVEFNEETLQLTALPVPGNEERWKQLQFDQITTGTGVVGERFTVETRPLFEWSEANACRFFVKVLDGTEAKNKQEYKAMMRLIEAHFYKKEVRLPISDPEALLVNQS